MENFYEINVSLDGQHFFATAPRSARGEYVANKLFDEIRERFPVEHGYSVSMTYWSATGTKVR